MEKQILKLKDTDGNDIEIEVLDIIENEVNNKNYIVYRVNNSEDVFISILNEEEETYSLDTIEDENEFKAIEKYLAQQAKEKLGESNV